MYRSNWNFNIPLPPGNPQAFDKSICSGARAGNLTFGSAQGAGNLNQKGGGVQAFEQNYYLDFVYIKLLSENYGILVHVIQHNLVSCVLIEVFNSILIMKQKLSCEWKEQQLNQLNEQISRNLFFLSQGRGHLGLKSFHMARHLTSNLIPGAGNFTSSDSKVQMPESGPGTAEQLWDFFFFLGRGAH